MPERATVAARRQPRAGTERAHRQASGRASPSAFVLPTAGAPGPALTPMAIDWAGLFELGVPPLEMIVRGTAMYWLLLVLFRVVIRRRVGAVGISDILVLVIIADASQNAMSGEYRSITDGAILVATIVAWNYAVDWAAYRSPRLRRLLEPPPLLLVDRGRVLRRNLRHELVSDSELHGKLREHGVDDVAEVERAYMESDGQFTVLKRRKRR